MDYKNPDCQACGEAAPIAAELANTTTNSDAPDSMKVCAHCAESMTTGPNPQWEVA